MVKTLKNVVKKNPEPAKGKNADAGQLGQYSAKYNISEDGALERYLSAKGINVQFVSKDTKIAHAKSNEFLKWKRDHMVEDITTQHKSKPGQDHLTDLSVSPTRRRLVTLKKAKSHYEIPSPPGTMKREGSQMSALTPESVEVNEVSSELLGRYKEKAKKSADALTAAGKHKQSTDRWMNVMKATGKQMDKTTASIRKALNKEDVGDAKAAVNADGLPNPQLEPVSEKKKQMSKSARMIKAIYKHHKVVKEDMHDHEKEDKSVQTYGKKPKFEKAEKDEGGEKKPSAAAVMTGGTTLTGNKRDDIEIDPMMRNRPGQPDVTKKDDKKKDDKKKDEKK